MKKIKGFSYDTEKDKDVIQYIEKQPHQANYIIELIRKDMSNKNDKIEELVKKYVKEILKDKNIETKSNEKENNISKNEVVDLLNRVEKTIEN